MTTEYIPADTLSDEQITAAARDGTLEAWRVDASGRQWFRRAVTGAPTPGSKVYGVEELPNAVAADLANRTARTAPGPIGKVIRWATGVTFGD